MFRQIEEATAHRRASAMTRRAAHHPDFDKLRARGWKALEAEAKLGR